MYIMYIYIYIYVCMYHVDSCCIFWISVLLLSWYSMSSQPKTMSPPSFWAAKQCLNMFECLNLASHQQRMLIIFNKCWCSCFEYHNPRSSFLKEKHIHITPNFCSFDPPFLGIQKTINPYKSDINPIQIHINPYKSHKSIQIHINPIEIP